MQVSRCVRRVGSMWRPRRGVVGRVAVRTLQTQAPRYALRFASGSGVVLGGCLAALLLAQQQQSDAAEAVDYKALSEDIKKLIESAPKTYDDGSYGPLFIRLAWHCAGSYSKYDKTGGSDGARMRFKPEADHGGNAGLGKARDLLEGLKKKYPGVSYADLYTLAGTVAIEALGGPKCKWRPGRSDVPVENFKPTPDGRLPDASQGADHLRHIFYRMGFTDQEIVALSGAHSLGRCHRDRSGFEGPWSNSPTMFSNDFFRLLLDEKWTERKWNGPRQFEDSSKKLMMLPSDLSLIEDAAFSHWVKAYAADEELFFDHFASAWSKLMELGVNYEAKPVMKKLFG